MPVVLFAPFRTQLPMYAHVTCRRGCELWHNSGLSIQDKIAVRTIAVRLSLTCFNG